jgi:hypothetical protein
LTTWVSACHSILSARSPAQPRAKDPQDAVPRAAHQQRRPVTAEALVLDRQQRRKAQPLPQLSLLLVTIPGEQAAQLADRGRQRVRASAQRFPGDTGLVELPFHVSRPQADLEPAAGEDVRGRDLPGQQRRVPERCVDHQRADPQPIGRGGRRDHRLERRRVPQMVRGENRVVAVVLGAVARRGELIG